MVAILILTISVSSMLGVTASSTISARYSRNEITANYLLQEAIDSVRNSRDTIAFQKKLDTDTNGAIAWGNFLSRYGYSGGKCFSTNGCILKMEDFNPTDLTGSDIEECGSDCPQMKYNPAGGQSLFYNYSGSEDSIFTRKVVMNEVNADEVKVTAYVSWKNESNSSTKVQTLEITLLNWQK